MALVINMANKHDNEVSRFIYDKNEPLKYHVLICLPRTYSIAFNSVIASKIVIKFTKFK